MRLAPLSPLTIDRLQQAKNSTARSVAEILEQIRHVERRLSEIGVEHPVWVSDDVYGKHAEEDGPEADELAGGDRLGYDRDSDGTLRLVVGDVTALRTYSHGPFRRL